ncbi:unnamed protein product [Mycena citricolor]|uniref:C2 NT-type domain-containing protein n=1 Tax=Mycena citricolor TaxID=2018698 RepID=A0AAD2K464_9AGAR|nr:unnamed protein product [Mycena citricolor]
MADSSGDQVASSSSVLKLGQLIPRHALFQVRIIIHQLASVPLVSGEFGVRWRFKNIRKLKGHETVGLEQEVHGDEESFGSGDSAGPSTEDAKYTSESYETQTSTRGQTPWLALRDHSVTWEQSLSTVVQMSIDRERHQLLPHPFKLAVLQRVIVGDPDAPKNPCLGVLELNLAEYSDSNLASPGEMKGTVTRRYLLRESKTNATLRLSVHVEPVGSPPFFTAPPLPRGEILAGLSSLLSTQDDVFRTRPRALNLYAPIHHTSQTIRPTFDIRALPDARSPLSTAALIEALFNPVPVRDEHLVTPFTRLVPEGTTPSYSTTLSFLSIDPTQRSSISPSHSIPNPVADESSNKWWKRSRSRARSKSRTRTVQAQA